MSLQVPTPGNNISDHLRRWREQRDLLSLLKAGRCVVRQGRAAELLYSLYCAGTSRPSTIRRPADISLTNALGELREGLLSASRHLSRGALIDALGDRYAVADLPPDFVGCRQQTIAIVDGRLVLGEYANASARIAIITRDRCAVFSPYEHMRGVRHIHLVCPTGAAGEVFVTTGDARKVLDRLTIVDGTPRLVKRHRERRGGYTAGASVDGIHYFGTDFSSRPNYLETLSGEKYFFPAEAYSRWVLSLTPMEDRYLVSLHRDMFGAEEMAVSVFDARAREFVLCRRWTDLYESERA